MGKPTKRKLTPPPADAPEYTVLKRSFIDGRMYEAGDTVRYAGKAGSNLEKVKGRRSKPDPKPDPEA